MAYYRPLILVGGILLCGGAVAAFSLQRRSVSPQRKQQCRRLAFEASPSCEEDGPSSSSSSLAGSLVQELPQSRDSAAETYIPQPRLGTIVAHGLVVDRAGSLYWPLGVAARRPRHTQSSNVLWRLVDSERRDIIPGRNTATAASHPSYSIAAVEHLR